MSNSVAADTSFIIDLMVSDQRAMDKAGMLEALAYVSPIAPHVK